MKTDGTVLPILRLAGLAGLAGLAFAAPLAARQADAPPTTPTGLHAVIYGGTADGEVRWNRSSDDRGAVRGYEITRDGVVLGVRDTLSVVERGLAKGTTYTYGITAIDGAGQRSGTATVTLSVAGGTPSGPAPGAPSDLRADVYSRTAAELFWSRSPAFGLRYEISRDGALVTTTDGTSYFDDALVGGTAHAYGVVAVDREGRRSGPSTVELTARGGTAGPPDGGDDPFAEPDPDGTTLVARLGYPAARQLADDLVSASYLGLYYDIDAALAGTLSDGARGADVTTACPGGGSARGENRTFLQDVVLDRCTIDGRTLSGALRREVDYDVFGAGGAQRAALTFRDLLIDTGAEGRLRLSGTSTRNDSSAAVDTARCGGAAEVVRETDNRLATVELERDGVVSTIVDARWRQSATTTPTPVDDFGREPCVGVRTLTAEGAARVESARFGAGGARFEKSVDIVRDPRDDAGFDAAARLAADFGDGSTLAVTAAPGTDGEAQVDIVADGAAVSFGDDYRFEAREDIATVRGD